MFTGLVESVGTIVSVQRHPDSVTLILDAPAIISGTLADHSIAVMGCCLTVEEVAGTTVRFTVVNETLHKTTLGRLTEGTPVNVERAMKLGDRVGGHLVQGHIDTVGTIRDVIGRSAGKELVIEFPPQWRRNVIPTGSVCVDGVSLTVAGISPLSADEAWLRVALIPHTLANTTAGLLDTGGQVNLEFDMMGKYALQN